MLPPGADHFRKAIEELTPLSDEQFAEVLARFELRRFSKKECLWSSGDVCRMIGFVTKGCLRYFFTDNKGEERIMYFATEGWWIADLNSLYSGKPSLYTLQALEDCELLLSTGEKFEEACSAVPPFGEFYGKKTRRSYSASVQRFADMQSESAEEKYLKLLKNYPQILQRVPQHYIASYLGIKPQSLSRIRKQVKGK